MPDIPYSPSIGAGSPELSQYMLSSEEIIIEITRELEGWVKETSPDGNIHYKKLTTPEITYSPECISWVQSKIRQYLNKNTYLARINSEEEMLDLQWSIQKAYLKELLCRWRDFELNEKKFLQLSSLHMNFVDFSLRRALYGGTGDLLSKTTSETTQRLDQKVTETNEKKGLFGLFGR